MMTVLRNDPNIAKIKIGIYLFRDTLVAVFERDICPDDVRDRICLNAARLTTYDKMKDEVAGVLLARQGRAAANADSWPSPMDIGWVGWKGKGDKGKKSNGKGDKSMSDKDKKDGKVKCKPADKSAGAKSEKTEKKCYWCGRRGHFQADCYFKKEYEKNKGNFNSVEEGSEKGETLAVHWVLAVVRERGETPIIDSGAVCSTCPPGFAPLATLEDAAEERPLRAANGLDLENFGMKVVKQELKLASGKPTQVLTKYRAANVQRPIISLSEAVNGGNVGFFWKDFSGIARAGARSNRRADSSSWVCSMRPKEMAECGRRAAGPSRRSPTEEARKSEIQSTSVWN